MLLDYFHVLMMILVAGCFVPLILFFGKFLRPSKPYSEKLTTYECGEEPVGNAWIQFNLRFYSLAILFIIFEVEIALIFPVFLIYKDQVSASFSLGSVLLFGELIFFVGILILGLAYAWVKRDLDWIRSVRIQ